MDFDPVVPDTMTSMGMKYRTVSDSNLPLEDREAVAYVISVLAKADKEQLNRIEGKLNVLLNYNNQKLL